MTRVPGENLVEDISFILNGPPARVVDVGCHHGATSRHYLDAFPDCEIWSFEANAENFAEAQAALASYGNRVHLACNAVSSQSGPVTLHVNSHDGTHSIYEIGEQRYWAAHVAPLEAREVGSVRLDDVFSEESQGPIDFLHMDIQGAELDALRGAERLLRERRIRLIYVEVLIFPLYRDQPLLWDIGQFLNANGFRLYSLYDRYYHANNPRALSWADALFICDELVQVPEHAPPTREKLSEDMSGRPVPGEIGIDLKAMTRAPFIAHATRADSFAFGSITTTEVCNLSCVMCHFNGPNAVKKGKTLDPALVRKAIDELPRGSQIYLGATGEFFLDPHALEHVRYAISRGLDPLILSHGQAYTPALLDELLEIGVRGFRISCDAIDAVHYERIRRGGKFEVILDAVAHLNMRRGDHPDLTVEIGCTLFRKTFSMQKDIEDFWRAHGVDRINFNAEYFDIFRYRNILATPSNRVDCDIQTYVLPSGKISPCCAVTVYAHDHDVDWLPDIRTHSLQEAYNELCDMYDDARSPLAQLCADCDWWIMWDRDPAGNTPYFRGVDLKADTPAEAAEYPPVLSRAARWKRRLRRAIGA